MAIAVELRRETGEVLMSGLRPYVPSELTRDYCRFPMLWGVDPHDITIFNHYQIGQVLVEIKELLDKDLSEEERASLEVVAKLCWEGLVRVHRYLWFVGSR